MTEQSAVWEFLTAPSQMGQPSRTAVGADGVRIRMADGKTLLCGTSGLWNVNFGYGEPRIADSIHRALIDASYLTLFRYGNQGATEAARELLNLAGPEHFARVLYATSGGTANEAAMKIARQFSVINEGRGRQLIVGITGSYHGLTYGSSALSGQELGQQLYGVDRRTVRHVSADDPSELAALCAVDGERIAALVIEPVLGSGAIAVPREFVEAAGKLADQYGFLVVSDEVATGFFRTGPFVASETWTRKPDLMILSKGLTNGTCAAACVLVGKGITDAFDAEDAVLVHGETQAGTPVSAAAILATLEVAADLASSGTHLDAMSLMDSLLLELIAESDGQLSLSGTGMFRGLGVLDADGNPLLPSDTVDLVEAIRKAGAIVHPGIGGVQLVPALVYQSRDVDELIACVRQGLYSLWACGSPRHAEVGLGRRGRRS